MSGAAEVVLWSGLSLVVGYSVWRWWVRNQARKRAFNAIHTHRIRPLTSAGAVAEIHSIMTTTTNHCTRVLGPLAVDTILLRMEYAEFQGNTGDPAAAYATYRRLVDDCASVYDISELEMVPRMNFWRKNAGLATGH